MARTLLLLRHAKSSWDDAALADFDRPLAQRGRDAAPRMGRLLKTRGWLPQLAIVSPAARTRQTWQLVAAELAQTPEAVFAEAIYEAPPQAILGAISDVGERISTLIVVGHNPGMEELAAALARPGSESGALARMREKFPTAALARFEVEDTWAALGQSGARLTDFIRPRDLD